MDGCSSSLAASRQSSTSGASTTMMTSRSSTGGRKRRLSWPMTEAEDDDSDEEIYKQTANGIFVSQASTNGNGDCEEEVPSKPLEEVEISAGNKDIIKKRRPSDFLFWQRPKEPPMLTKSHKSAFALLRRNSDHKKTTNNNNDKSSKMRSSRINRVPAAMIRNKLQIASIFQHYYPEGNWGYVILTCAFLAQALSNGVQMSFGILSVAIDRRWGLTRSKNSAQENNLELSKSTFIDTGASFLSARSFPTFPFA